MLVRGRRFAKFRPDLAIAPLRAPGRLPQLAQRERNSRPHKAIKWARAAEPKSHLPIPSRMPAASGAKLGMNFANSFLPVVPPQAYDSHLPLIWHRTPDQGPFVWRSKDRVPPCFLRRRNSQQSALSFRVP